MAEEIDLLKTIAAKLDSERIAYMMTGSMAMALYAAPRMTRDIDIVVHVTPAHVEKLLGLFRDAFYLEEAAVRKAVSEKGMFNLIHNESVAKVDMIVRKDDDYRIEEFSRRRAVDVDGVSISVVTPEDLILSKLL